MDEILNDFINNKTSNYNNLGGYTQNFNKEIKEYALEQFELLNQNEKVKYYYKHFFVTDSTISDYCNKIISIPNYGNIMTQIRFKNLNINEPFVEILFANFDFNTINIKHVFSFIVENYKSINIKKIRFFSESLSLNNKNNCKIDRLFYAKYFNNPSQSSISNSCKLKIETPNNIDFYDKYLYEYSKVNKEFSQPLSLKTIQELIIENLFFVIKNNEEIIGIIATDKKYLNALKGFEITDEIIFEKHRGNSCGRNAQSLLINKIISTHSEAYIIGAIHPNNIASIKTAESNERKCLGAWYFTNS